MAVAIPNKSSLADVLLKEGVINKDQYQRAIDEYDRTKRSLVRILSDMGVLTEDLRLDILRKNTSYEVVKLQNVVPSAEVSLYITKDMCTRAHAVPLRLDEGSVIVAMEDPTDIRILGDLEKIFGMSIKPVLATSAEINATIDRIPEGSAANFDQPVSGPSIGYRLFSTLILMIMVFVPLVGFYYFVNRTEAGGEWFGSFGLNRFETVLLYVVTWSSWAAIAFFIHDILFNKKEE